MTHRALGMLSAAVLAWTGCGGAGPDAPAPSLRLNGIAGGALDPDFASAWDRAAAHPENGLDYPLGVHSSALPRGTKVILLMARYTGLFANGVPVTSGDYLVSASATDASGDATFPPLAVATGSWSESSSSIPAALLCGETLVMARALDGGGTLLASTWFSVVTPPCP